MSRRVLRVLLPLVFWLGLWQMAASAISQELLLPTPMLVLQTLLSLMGSSVFWRTAALTLVRVFGGAVLGAVLGATLGALTSASWVLDCILSPAIRLVLATPVSSFIMLVLLWVKTGTVPAVISALIVLPVVWGAVTRGVRETDPNLLEMAHAYRFGRLKTIRLVIVPSVIPYFSSACQSSVGLSWKAGVAAEVLCRPALAIGSQVYLSKINLETPSLFAWTAVVIVFSLLIERVLSRALTVKGGRK